MKNIITITFTTLVLLYSAQLSGQDTDADGIPDASDNCVINNPSLRFDGTDDYVTLPNEEDFDFTTTMTVEAWIKVDAFDNFFQTIVAKGDDSWRITRNANENTLHFVAGSTINGSINVNDGKWHHIAGVADTNNVMLYVDGVLDAVATTGTMINNSAFPVWIGNNSQVMNRHFEGVIDEVRIWDIARDSSDIRANMYNELAGTETGLVAYYKFNQGVPNANNGSITSAMDDAGTNNGTLENFAQSGIISNWVGSNPDQTDTDMDGVGDLCDVCPGFSDSLSSIIYVDVAATGSNNGVNWMNAFTDLQDAIDASATCGGIQEIWVAKGSYHPTQSIDLDGSNGAEDREKTFYIDHPVQIYGGFDGDEMVRASRDSLSEETILTAAIPNSTDTAFHVMYMTADSITTDWVIDGLVIRDGRAEGSTFLNEQGGGLYAEANDGDLKAIVANCTFSNNAASGNGGGMFAFSSATNSPTLSNCTFSNNSASASGGGMFAFSSATNSPTLSNCTFSNNSANGSGGGMYALAFTTNSPTLSNCTFSNNSASDQGGGMYALAFTTNSPTLSNCILWGNHASEGPDIGKSDSNSGLSNGSITHSIIIQDSISGMIDYDMTTNLEVDPMLVDGDGNDLRLLATSPAINAGINDSIPDGITTDLDGNPRIQSGRVDIGAYEGASCDASITRIYVDSDAMGDESGMDWEHAFTDLQDAINLSASCSDVQEIWVAKGSYHPTQSIDLDGSNGAEDREKTFYIDHPVRIYGGFDGDEMVRASRDSLSEETILTAAIPNSTDTAFHVMYMTADSITTDWVIDGLVIRDGRAEGSTFLNEQGGGLYAEANDGDLKAIVADCTFSNNAASGSGGGMYARVANTTNSPTLSNCTFSNNSAGGSGGGMYAFSNATNSPTLSNCTFSNNSASASGGGMYARASNFLSTNSPTLSNCTFSNNSASGSGGGMYARASNFLSTNSPTLSNSTFSNNSANGSGGGMYAFSITTNSPTLSNCILWGNHANEGPDIWKSDSNSGLSNGSITHSIIIQDSISGTIDYDEVTNIEMDPMFQDATDDLRLKIGSPAINAGLNQAIASETDLDGKTRLIGARVDMGAYEHGTPDNCNQNVFLHPQEFINEEKVFNTDQLIFATNKITSNNITYDARLGTELGYKFEVADGANFQIELGGCP